MTAQHARDTGSQSGEGEAEDIHMLDGEHTQPTPAEAGDIPPLPEQIEHVMSLMMADWMKEGVKGYVLSYKWLGRVLSRGPDPANAARFGKEAREGPIGAVDNTDIWLDDGDSVKFQDEGGEPFAFIKDNLTLGEDLEVVPEQAWRSIVEWYGQAAGSPTITRYCHNTSPSDVQENLQFELHPPIFTMLKLPDTTQGMAHKDLTEREAPPIRILASRHERYQTFLKRAKTEVGIEMKTKVRVWRLPRGLGSEQQTNGMLTPAQSRSNSPVLIPAINVDAGEKLVIDVNTFSQLQLGEQREHVDARDETNNANYNGQSTIDFVGLRQSEVIVLEEMVGGPAGGEWVSDASTAKANGVTISVTKNGATTSRDTLKPSAASSRHTSPAPTGMMTRGRASRMGRSRGTVGLGNLGNTCYMNSALQCVRSVEELTMYFLEEQFKTELNPSNPLSHNGDVAKAYAKLLHEMYDPKQVSSFTPRNFKNTIGRYGPSFSGYQQQDSQEFLLFLLDGLQEDLNRIHQKPYIEKPDSTDEMVKNPEALRQMADKCWDIYKKRNDSVITDLFAGMYKSTLVCPVCDKVSIIFDPFNNLTLQLPIQNIWSKDIYFFPLQSTPFRVSIDIDKNSSWGTLSEYLAKKLGLEPKRLIFTEIWQNKLYKIFEPKKSINEDNVADADHIACFEVEDIPTNFPAPKKSKKTFSYYGVADEEVIPEGDSPLADKMLVSVFNRKPKNVSSRYASATREFFGMPSLILVTREEAQDFDAVLKKCLSRVAMLTTRDFLREEDSATASTEGSDTVLLNGDDSSDTKIHTESLASEEGMVDISMGDATEQSIGAGPAKFPRSAVAPILKPGAPMSPAVRQLFEMKTYSSGTEMIPMGFQAFMADEDRKLPSIASRLKATQARPVGEREATPDAPKPRSTDEAAQNHAMDSPPTSDEDDEALPPPAQPPRPAPAPAPLDDGSDSDGLPEVEQIVQPEITSTSGKTDLPANHARKGGRVRNTYSKKEKRRARVQAAQRPAAVDTDLNQADNSGQGLVRLGECIVLDWTEDGYDALFAGSTAMDVEEDGPVRGSNTWDEMPLHADPELDAKRTQRNKRRKSGFSLGDCLDEFGKSEILSENDAWYCPRCKEHRRASKTFELWKAPDILVIHLKRFSTQGRFNNKLDVMVDFPLEGLDLTGRLATKPDEGKSPVYELFAVDNHYGGLGGGHYTAYAKNFIDKGWYEYNDAFVSRREGESIITPAAYLLFYRRVSSTPLGGPFFEDLMTSHEATSQPPSRTPSPAGQSGEGRRLDDSSRNGSSSALRKAGAAHQTGGGGAAGTAVEGPAKRRRNLNHERDNEDYEDAEEELPSYGFDAEIKDAQTVTLEGMEVDDVDEGIGMGPHVPSAVGRDHPAWSFDALHQDERTSRLVDKEEEEGSMHAEGLSSMSERDDRMADFDADAEGNPDNGIGAGFGTPERRPDDDLDEEGRV